MICASTLNTKIVSLFHHLGSLGQVFNETRTKIYF